MADADKILCPGCGAEMELSPLADYGLLYGFQYHCPRCGWDSPLMQTEREAREMAGKRIAEPVKHAYWQELLGCGYTVCSACDFIPYSVNDKYCPNCGAKMDAKED